MPKTWPKSLVIVLIIEPSEGKTLRRCSCRCPTSTSRRNQPMFATPKNLWIKPLSKKVLKRKRKTQVSSGDEKHDHMAGKRSAKSLTSLSVRSFQERNDNFCCSLSYSLSFFLSLLYVRWRMMIFRDIIIIPLKYLCAARFSQRPHRPRRRLWYRASFTFIPGTCMSPEMDMTKNIFSTVRREREREWGPFPCLRASQSCRSHERTW